LATDITPFSQESGVFFVLEREGEMRKYLPVSAVFILAIMISIPAHAQSAKEAIMGLKKLQARCQSGISYRDYSNAVADAKFPVNLFMESAEAKSNPELTDAINKAMKHYEYAGQLWNLKMTASRYEIDLRHGFFQVDTDTGIEIGKLYPQAVPHKGRYFLNDIFSIIWGEASQELENITKLYAKTERETSSDIEKLKKENEQLKAIAERLKAENENLKKQIELMTPKRKK